MLEFNKNGGQVKLILSVSPLSLPLPRSRGREEKRPRVLGWCSGILKLLQWCSVIQVLCREVNQFKEIDNTAVTRKKEFLRVWKHELWCLILNISPKFVIGELYWSNVDPLHGLRWGAWGSPDLCKGWTQRNLGRLLESIGVSCGKKWVYDRWAYFLLYFRIQKPPGYFLNFFCIFR